MINPDTAPPCAICNSHRDANVHLAQYRYARYHEYRAPLPIIDVPAIVREQFPTTVGVPHMSDEVVDLGDETPRAERPGSAACKHPEVVVKLLGTDGNAFSVLGKVQTALRRANVPREEVNEYLAKATDGDYDHLLAVTMQWVTVE